MKSDHRSKFSNLNNWKEGAWKKKSVLQRDSNPWPQRHRCDALPTELWSPTLGARLIYWVHIFPCSKVMWSLYEIICFLSTAEKAAASKRMELPTPFRIKLGVLPRGVGALMTSQYPRGWRHQKWWRHNFKIKIGTSSGWGVIWSITS